MPFLNAKDFEAVRAAMVPFEDDPDLDAAKALMDAAADGVATPDEVAAASALHACDEIEIDDEGAGASHGDDGYWVQAWVWVPKPDEEEDDDDAVPA